MDGANDRGTAPLEAVAVEARAAGASPAPGAATGGHGAPRATSAAWAVALIAAVAVVVAGALVTWARAAADGQTDGAVTLAFGIEPGPLPPSLPPQVGGELVVGGRALPGVPPQAGGCGFGDLAEDSGPARVVAVPEFVLVAEEVAGSGSVRSCVLAPGVSSSSESSAGGATGRPIGGGCCTPEGYGWNEAFVDPPAGARWALQDRGGWWVAYPVTGPTVHIVWTYAGSGDPFASQGISTPVVFVDEGGDVVGERPPG